MNKIKTVFCLLWVFLILGILEMSAQNDGISGADDAGLYMDIELSSSSVTKGEPVIARIWLYSPAEYDIAYVRQTGNADYASFDTRVASDPSNARVVGTVKNEGKDFYKLLAGEMVLFPTEPGNFQLRFPDFEVGVIAYPNSRGSFWDMFTRPRTIPVSLSNKERQRVKVSNFSGRQPSGFSKAVGDFKLVSILPPGDIIKGRDCLLVYELEGTGSLEDYVFPEIKSFFPGSVEVKSVVPNERCYIEGDQLKYKITYDVTFIPKELGKITLPAVGFVYYDVKKKKFVQADAEEVTIDVVEPKKKSVPQAPVYI